MRQVLTTVAAAIALAAAAGCGTSQTTVPSPTGPSTFALSLTMTATPDSLTIDGGSQSAIAVQANNASGGPQVGLAASVSKLPSQEPWRAAARCRPAPS